VPRTPAPASFSRSQAA